MSSLDPEKPETVPWRSMHRFRTIITAIIALALAGLPVPAAAMHASMIAGSGIADTAASEAVETGATNDHCCEKADDCAKHSKKGCDASGACALQCTPLSANVVAEIQLPRLTTPSLVTAAAAERLTAGQAHPLLPPPRV